MALTAQPASHPNWGRWAQQVPPEYGMVDSRGMVVYSHRPESSPDMMGGPAPFMTSQYMVPASYSSPAVQSLPAPHYPASNHPYAPFGGPPHMVSATTSFKQDYQGQHDAGAAHRAASVHSPTHDDDKPFMRHGHMSPPLSRRGSEISSEQLADNPTLRSQTITANQTLDPKDRIEFDTDVDQLMRAIQVDGAAGEAEPQAFTPAPSPKVDEMSARSSPVSSTGSLASQGTTKPRKYICDGPNCNKGFSQKTHLDIHKRTHTGKRPYVSILWTSGLWGFELTSMPDLQVRRLQPHILPARQPQDA